MAVGGKLYRFENYFSYRNSRFIICILLSDVRTDYKYYKMNYNNNNNKTHKLYVHIEFKTKTRISAKWMFLLVYPMA